MYYYRAVGTRVAGAAATIPIFETCSRAVKMPPISIFGASDGPVYTENLDFLYVGVGKSKYVLRIRVLEP